MPGRTSRLGGKALAAIKFRLSNKLPEPSTLPPPPPDDDSREQGGWRQVPWQPAEPLRERQVHCQQQALQLHVSNKLPEPPTPPPPPADSGQAQNFEERGQLPRPPLPPRLVQQALPPWQKQQQLKQAQPKQQQQQQQAPPPCKKLPKQQEQPAMPRPPPPPQEQRDSSPQPPPPLQQQRLPPVSLPPPLPVLPGQRLSSSSSAGACTPAPPPPPAAFALDGYTPLPPAAASTPLLADYTPLPPPLPPPAAQAQAAASSSGSPVVPAFIQQLWQQKAGAGSSSGAAPPAVQPSASGAAAAAPPRAVPAGSSAPAAPAPVAAKAEPDVEEGEITGESGSSSAGASSAPEPAAHPALAVRPSTSDASSSRGLGGSQSQRGVSSHHVRQDSSRGRQRDSRASSHRRERSCSWSSCSSAEFSRNRSRRRRAGVGGRNRRRSRSPLRRVARGDAVSKRRTAAPAAAAPAGDPQLALASLVDSMAAEAASLRRQLGRLALSEDRSTGGRESQPDTAASGCSKGAAGALQAAAPAASASRKSGASTADVERQLSSLSTKLGQLSICLQSMQHQPQLGGHSSVAAEAEQAEEGQLSGSLSTAEAGVTYVCFDTCVWMDYSKTIKECFKRVLASSGSSDGASSRVRFLLPLAVVAELDGLKRCLFRGIWARKAIGRLEQMQGGGHAALRGQRQDEQLARGWAPVRRGDDGILDCLLLFRSRGAQVELVTKDVNLRVRARIEGIPCAAPDAMRARVGQLLDAAAAPVPLLPPGFGARCSSSR